MTYCELTAKRFCGSTCNFELIAFPPTFDSPINPVSKKSYCVGVGGGSFEWLDFLLLRVYFLSNYPFWRITSGPL